MVNITHYRVAIFTEYDDYSWDNLLAPYDEGIEVEPYLDYTKEQLVEKMRSGSFNFRFSKDDDFDYATGSDEELYARFIKGSAIPSDLIHENGDIYTRYNPKSKWDWYSHMWTVPAVEEAYRDSGKFLKTKRVLEKYNVELIQGGYITSEFDFGSRDYDDIDDQLKIAINYLKLLTKRPHGVSDEVIDKMISIVLNLSYQKNKLNGLIEGDIEAPTYCVITPDGEWHAPGNIGFFAMTDATPEEEDEWVDKWYERFYIPAIKNNWYITIVDCHI